MTLSRKSKVESQWLPGRSMRPSPGLRPSIFDLRQPRLGARRAFTLIELMVVVGVMALLFTISIPSIYHLTHPESMRTSVEKLIEACGEARAYAILQSVT